jgi:dipeptidyl aminopeptidase/acylaminoacyl peptidase
MFKKVFHFIIIFMVFWFVGCKYPTEIYVDSYSDANTDPYPLVSPPVIDVTSGAFFQTFQLDSGATPKGSELYDEDGDVVSVVSSTLPPNILLNEATGLLTITRSSSFSGSINFWTEDPNGGTTEDDSLIITITVTILETTEMYYASDRDGDLEIYSMDLDTGVSTALTNNTATDKHPSISDDGTKIAFVSNRSGSWAIYTMDTDGSNVSPALVSLSGVNDGHPSWKPDCSMIVYDDDFDIFTMNSDGSSVSNLTLDECKHDTYPDWSPNGLIIAYQRETDIYTMDTDGSNQTRLTNDVYVNEIRPAWSPDGANLTYSCRTLSDSFYDIYIMDADGSEKLNITNTASAGESSPAWSSDSRVIVYVKNEDELYKKDADGSGLETNLTNDGSLDQDPTL